MVGSVSADAVIHGSIDPPAVIGKLPGHGDFLARRVDYGLREPLDRWMSDWIELAREERNEDFETAYENAAPWLFEGGATNAVFMPSVDSVGRLFPVLAICSASIRTQEIYDTLIAGLESAVKADELIGQLDDLADQEAVVESGGAADWFLPEGAEQNLPSPGDVASWPAIREHFA